MNTGVEYFVKQGSIVREIWRKADTILFIFAGSAAEFALNKAVDWLYFTGKLPADPIGRLFSTVTYARLIVFSELDAAHAAIDKITAIHSGVEKSRAAKIPDWAYRDVLFMLIHYSIASFELLERKLDEREKDELFDVFYRMGTRMQLTGLPKNHGEWLVMHDNQLQEDLQKSHYTADLYKQYKKHLGSFRYALVLESQRLIVPPRVNELLDLGHVKWLHILLPFYKFSRILKIDGLIKTLLVPAAYRSQIRALDIVEY
ncbi:MAG TPA: oxygenase MpaB family protein [Ferruginibacter sp.]|nr:oxygenase MpaB family protein [Ferruginibacter sp.]